MTDDNIDNAEGESTPERLDAVDRRTVMRTVGATTAAGALGSGVSGTASAQSNDWESQADQRIQENRMGTLDVQVQDQNGNPVSGADVSVEMQEHDFGFGTAIHSEFLTNGTEWGNPITYNNSELTEEDRQQYRETIPELFNEVVLENLHKWYLWEDNTQIADDAVDWAVGEGLDVRGHVCIWGNLEAYALPPRVVEAMGDPWASNWSEAGQPNKDIQKVKNEASNHIDEIINHYGDDIKEWEVMNEVLHKPSIIEAIEGQGVTPETAEILGDWYQQAQETAAQYDCGVAVNDYNVMAENNYNEPSRYEDQIDYLVNERGIDLDGAGMQCHFALQERKSPDEIMQTLDRYAQYDVGLRTTELDMFIGTNSNRDWTEQEEADFLYQYLKTFFSHPAAEDFLVWGHWTPLHWGDDYGSDSDNTPQNAPFFRPDWSEKPALGEYRDLVFDQWWTSEAGSTDGQGSYSVSAFLGTHEISVNDGEATTTVEITDPSTKQITLTVSGGGDPSGTPGRVGSNTALPNDPDGDGLYEDVNGNERQDIADAVDLFQNRESVDAEFFDFNESGGMSIGDAVSLFRENT